MASGVIKEFSVEALLICHDQWWPDVCVYRWMRWSPYLRSCPQRRTTTTSVSINRVDYKGFVCCLPGLTASALSSLVSCWSPFCDWVALTSVHWEFHLAASFWVVSAVLVMIRLLWGMSSICLYHCSIFRRWYGHVLSSYEWWWAAIHVARLPVIAVNGNRMMMVSSSMLSS